MANAEKNRARYLSAKPFPSIMLDDFLPNQILEKVISEFPSPDANLEWRKSVAKTDDAKIAQINKLGFSDETKMHPVIRQLLWELNSSKFLLFCSQRCISDDHSSICPPYSYFQSLFKNKSKFSLLLNFQRGCRLKSA